MFVLFSNINPKDDLHILIITQHEASKFYAYIKYVLYILAKLCCKEVMYYNTL